MPRSAPNVDFAPTVTASQGSCDGSNREIDVTLNNSSSNVATNFVVTYTVNGGSAQSLTSGTSVSSSSNNTSLSVPGQSNGAAVVISWYAENTANDLREPTTSTTALSSITIDASSCNPGSVSATTSLNSCSSGTATSSIAITASGATMYVDVQWSTNNSSWTTLQNGNAISSGATETYTISSAQSHGTTIYWQYRASSSGNPSSGSYTSATSRTVSCPTVTFTTSTSAGTCSGTSSTPSISVTNTGNITGYFDVQWSTNNSSWTTLQNGNAISSGATETYSVTSAQSHGTTVYFQVRSGTSNPSSGSYTAATAVTVSCGTPTYSLTQSLGACSGGQQAPSLVIENTGSAAIFDVSYKLTLNGSDISDWIVTRTDMTLTAGQSWTRTLNAMNQDYQITWRVRAGTSAPSDGDWTTAGTGLIVDCVSATSLTASQSLGSCSSGAKTSTLSLQNSSGSTAYVTAEYSLNGGSSWTVHTDAQEADNLTISNGSTNTSLTVSVSDGSAIQWRYKSSNSSGSWSGLSYVTASDMNSTTV